MPQLRVQHSGRPYIHRFNKFTCRLIDVFAKNNHYLYIFTISIDHMYLI